MMLMVAEEAVVITVGRRIWFKSWWEVWEEVVVEERAGEGVVVRMRVGRVLNGC